MPRSSLDIADDLAPVQAMLADGLARVERRFDEHLASELLPVERLCAHIERYRGKMLRPSLVMLAGLAFGEPAVSEDHITLAAVCEMVHMATLVHDDVLDEAENRRRGRTVNHLYGNEAAVILGDYLIAGAYHLCTTTGSLVAARLIGEVSMTLCGGELLQLHYRDDFSLDEPTYFAILDRKTAALIGVACRLGAMLAGAGEPQQSALETFGRRLGVAFQIQDDLIDLLGSESTAGKSVGKDLEKGKLTLPVLHHLGRLAPADRGRFLEQLAAAGGPSPNDGRDTPRGTGDAPPQGQPDAHAAARDLRDQLIESGAVEAARAKARGLVAEARSQLTTLPATPARGLLDLMAQAVVQRDF